ncbi:carbonic anhydrase [Hyphobacterium sp. CCMP332]|nr:carbonic anhydrase [Hyphobacterium sp. CCMP332]
MDTYRRLLLNNKAWVQEKLSLANNYFLSLAKKQNPEFLWIGCSDSRVPAEEITGTQAGEIYVHRNVGNLVVPKDANMLSALQYSVEILDVKHIIVCGHYGCGGIEVAMDHSDFGVLDNWLENVKGVYNNHKEELDKLENRNERFKRIVELNVIAQVENLLNTEIIKNKWQKDSLPLLHGWVYDVETGILKDLVLKSPLKAG